jgi:cyclic pyranopterin phosphate synthase
MNRPVEAPEFPAPVSIPHPRENAHLLGVFLLRSPDRYGYFRMTSSLSHFDADGASRMVDVGDKPVTARTAEASGRVRMRSETLKLIQDRCVAKGDVLEVARLAGIMAAKRTADLIPLCHPLALESIEIAFGFPEDDCLEIRAVVRITAKTGVEMEALVAVSTAALTVYDMCKSVDRGMTIEQIRLEGKSGGRSGTFQRQDKRATP